MRWLSISTLAEYGYCISDELAKQGTTVHLLLDKEDTCMPLATCKLLLLAQSIRDSENIWQSTPHCRVARQTWLHLNKTHSKILCELSKTDCSAVVRALTGHSRSKKGKKPPWWNSKPGELRKSSRTLFNQAKAVNTEEFWLNYKHTLSTYKKAKRKAKRNLWRAFCSGVFYQINPHIRLPQKRG